MEGSRLGLKEYWEEAYEQELKSLDEFGDEGEIWFGENVLETMVEFTKTAIDGHCQTNGQLGQVSVMDIGTGNGVFLHEFAKMGFKELLGTDYSPQSVQLCKKLASKKGFEGIRFVVDDVLASSITERFDVACDKGTFDAIGLAPDGSKKRLKYPAAVAGLLKPGGLLVITSCNNTKDELVEEFEKSTCFKYLDHVKTYPSFSFGGREGTTVASVAFRCISSA